MIDVVLQIQNNIDLFIDCPKCEKLIEIGYDYCKMVDKDNKEVDKFFSLKEALNYNEQRLECPQCNEVLNVVDYDYT